MPPTILVVDDEDSIAALLRDLLEDEGYQVVTAGDGRAALDRLAAQPVALVLSDVMLPHLDGRALARAMHADPAQRAIPLVLVSAAGAAGVRDAPHAAFLRKPFDLDALLATVARHHRLTRVLDPPPSAVSSPALGCPGVAGGLTASQRGCSRGAGGGRSAVRPRAARRRGRGRTPPARAPGRAAGPRRG